MKPQSNHHRTALVSGASIHTPKKTTMSRCLCHFAACLALVPVSALANHVDAQVSITSVSPIFVSVSNTSGSTNVNERLLTMTTPATITVRGGAQAKNLAVVQSVQLHFGLDFIQSGPNGHTLWGIWDSSAPQLFQSTNSVQYDITHDIAISPTWDLGTLVTLRPNAVKVVEDQLKAYVNGGGKALDFLQQDAAFEIPVKVYATVTAERNGSVFFDTVGATTTMHILYKGDPNLKVQTVGNNPNTLLPNKPNLPQVAVYAPQMKGSIAPARKPFGKLRGRPPGGGVRLPVDGGNDERLPEDGGNDERLPVDAAR